MLFFGYAESRAGGCERIASGRGKQGREQARAGLLDLKYYVLQKRYNHLHARIRRHGAFWGIMPHFNIKCYEKVTVLTVLRLSHGAKCLTFNVGMFTLYIEMTNDIGSKPC
jgi:hypothetical protein